MEFLTQLEDLLKEDENFLAEDGQILKSKIYDAAMDMDEKLLDLLISDDVMKNHFFKEVNGILIFDKVKFTWVIESKEFLPNSYTMYKNKIGLADDKRDLISKKGDITLVWPYKDCVLEGGQDKEEQKRNEIFYNETLSPDEVSRLLYPKVFTNSKRYTENGAEEITEFDENDNLIIKGNNLLVLSSLLKRYEGKVQCIYIDPPYNTGSDTFKYNDSFNGSTWLTFMKNRLELSRRILSDSGLIFIQCDDNEQAYLKVLCDEIFGENNFLNTLSVKMSPSSGVKRRFANIQYIKNVEYILVYKKKFVELNPIHDPVNIYDENYNVFFDGTVITTLSKKIEETFPEFAGVTQTDYLHVPKIKKFIVDNKNNIYRRDLASKWALEKVKDKDKIFQSKEKKLLEMLYGRYKKMKMNMNY